MSNSGYYVKITKIQKAKKHLSSVYIDGEFYALLDDDIIYQNNIKENDDVTLDDMEVLRDKSEFKRAREKALYLLDFKDYSSYDMQKKLSKDYDSDVVLQVIKSLEDMSFINDYDYAKRYANTLLKLKNFSGKRIKLELLKKGIDKYIIDDVIDNLCINPKEKIKELLLAKINFSSADEKSKRRIVAKLIRMGYNYDDIKSAAYEMDIDL